MSSTRTAGGETSIGFSASTHRYGWGKKDVR